MKGYKAVRYLKLTFPWYASIFH